ncbi:actin-binding LIM protein 3 isoform X2 [Folsomia candida]|uniref:actin-binding LIM protein 3 isoform X2 n=1 Tax=Folsomia candida TaxID=158441 RepID=UPI000B8EF9BB|nr:actin-binding LIM protein 3 isoform X2 [Folsomia candida]
MHPKHTISRVTMAPQLHNGNGVSQNGNAPTSLNGTTTNGHRNFLNGNSNGPTPSPSQLQTAYELNPKEHDIKVVIRDGRIVAGEETLPFKRNNRFSFGKTTCQACKKKCSGEVLRVQDKYFHIACFKCKVCASSLAQGGFFFHEGEYYCTSDYQQRWGTQCGACGRYVEGEVVTALGNTYHQACFTCARCRKPFPTGAKVTVAGREILCQRCVNIPIGGSGGSTSDATSPVFHDNAPCAGCGKELRDAQALVALDKQWHIWCFKCKACDIVLHGEYMGKDGVPYCEKDYQKSFGVRCAYCNRYISGKVLQAGENHHFHPTCARCTKCGDPFGDGEEMYLQGTAIWHPRCGPGPNENGTILNGIANISIENGHPIEDRPDSKLDHSCSVSETQFSLRSRTPSLTGSLYSPFNSLNRKYSGYRTSSPGLILREYKSPYPEDITRIYTYSYLTAEPTQGYLKKPIDPYDRPPVSPHFHRPPSTSSRTKIQIPKTHSRSGMKAMVEHLVSETPRPRSPHMNNEEPIELAHYPAAKPPRPEEQAKIERDDFPAPPYPYTDPERRKRWSDSWKGVSASEDEDETDTVFKAEDDPKLKKEEVELSKIATGIGKVFLQNVKEREKIRAWKMNHLDPRNASRTPSANKEPAFRLRYESPHNASPSRNMDHPRPWEEDEIDRGSSYRSSVGRSVGTIPAYNVVSSLRTVPKPGYGLKSATLPAVGRNGGPAGMAEYPFGQSAIPFGAMGEKTHSTEFSSARSDISTGSITEADRRALGADVRSSTTYTGGFRYPSASPHLRRSLPNMTPQVPTEPLKVYPYHLLMTTNYRLPADVDRNNLERHLSDAEFEAIFHMSRMEFYRQSQWKRNDMKRRIRMF